ncbi:MAG: hypothetical protein EAZ53_13055 [Bacteroidetes bacterium]|nr:MAG: hypothetical protein EAZ53_13055 [Bacteroidota bacterium]
MKSIKFMLLLLSIFLCERCKNTYCEPAPPLEFGRFYFQILDKKNNIDYFKSLKITADSFYIINLATNKSIRATIDTNRYSKPNEFIYGVDMPDFYENNNYEKLFDIEKCNKFLFRYSKNASDTFILCATAKKERKNTKCQSSYYSKQHLKTTRDSTICLLTPETISNGSIIIYK